MREAKKKRKAFSRLAAKTAPGANGMRPANKK